MSGRTFTQLALDESEAGEHFYVSLRFNNVSDPEMLLIDIDLMLESLSEEGVIERTSDDD